MLRKKIIEKKFNKKKIEINHFDLSVVELLVK